MRKASQVLFLSTAFMITGCNLDRETKIDSPKPEPSEKVSEISNLPMVEPSVFHANKDLWQSKGIKDYDFVLHHIRYDGMMPSPTFKIAVRDSKVRSFRSVDGKKVPHEEGFSTIATIEDLLKIVTPTPTDTRQIFVRFDSEFGYPLKIETRGRQMHSIFLWEVIEFTPITRR